jgi:hypothetical protein
MALIFFAGATAFAQNLPAVDAPVQRGLDFLVSQQQPDGSFGDPSAGGPRAAVSGLGLLAFLSGGNVPELGRYGAAVRAVVDHLVATVPEDGYLGKVDGSRMYGQAMVTLALAEAWGVEPDEFHRASIRRAVEKMTRVILDAQNVRKPKQFAGGWRYDRDSNDSDLWASVWNALALRAAWGSGVDVPGDALRRAADFVETCHGNDGGFNYQPGSGPSSAASTGGALFCLYLLGQSQMSQRATAAKFLREHPVDDQTRFPYYAMYYTTQAALAVDEPTWSAVGVQNMKRLLQMQQPDGSWPQSRSGEEPGVVYATALAVLTLETPDRLLPAYQPVAISSEPWRSK